MLGAKSAEIISLLCTAAKEMRPRQSEAFLIQRRLPESVADAVLFQCLEIRNVLEFNLWRLLKGVLSLPDAELVGSHDWLPGPDYLFPLRQTDSDSDSDSDSIFIVY